MASRKYYRDNRGQFSSRGSAVSVTEGRAGGFANRAFASRVKAGTMAPANPSGQRSTLRSRVTAGAQGVGRQLRSNVSSMSPTQQRTLAMAGAVGAAKLAGALTSSKARQSNAGALGVVASSLTRSGVGKTVLAAGVGYAATRLAAGKVKR